MKYLFQLIGLFMILGASTTNAQNRQYVTITKHSGDTLHLLTNLVDFKKDYVFPSDNKKFIKGNLVISGESAKVFKREISTIGLNDGSEYIVIKNNSKDKPEHLIGFFVVLNGQEYFKTYAYGRVSGSMDAGSSGFGFSPASIHKIASVSYYVIRGEVVTKIQ